MKQRSPIIILGTTVLILAVGPLASRVLAAPSAITNTAPAVAEAKPGHSIFVVPKDPKEGKDPFFPRSLRPYGTGSTAIKTGSSNTPPAIELNLNGISGNAEKPLAIINNVTFGINDDNDVIIKGRRIKIRCLDINLEERRVRVQVGSELRDLRLPIGR